MADTISNVILFQNQKRVVIRSDLTCDGVAATDLVAVDRSTLTGPDGTEPGKLCVEAIEYSLNGVDAIVEFDGTTDVVIAKLGGSSAEGGRLDFTQNGKYHGVVDSATGATGDIIVTTANSSAGDSGSIVFYIRKKD